MTWIPFQCPYCFAKVRGDAKECSQCGEPLHVSEWGKLEQAAEEAEALGICELCERPLTECDSFPCWGEGEQLNLTGN